MTTATTLPTGTSTAQDHTRRGTALMVLGGLILGTVGVFAEEARADPITTVLFRCVFGGLALLVWGASRGKLSELALKGRSLIAAIAIGVLIVVNWGLFFAAIPRTSTGIATVVFHIQPFWVLAMGAWLLHQRVSKAQAIAAAIAFAGLLLSTGIIDGISNPAHLSHDYLVGLSICLLGSLAYAGVVLVAMASSGASPYALAFWQCLVGAAITAWWPFVHGWPEASGLPWLAGLGAIHTGLAYAVLYAGMSHLQASRIAVLQFVYPITAILLDWLLYGHRLSVLQQAGLLVMAGALWSVKREQ